MTPKAQSVGAILIAREVFLSQSHSNSKMDFARRARDGREADGLGSLWW